MTTRESQLELAILKAIEALKRGDSVLAQNILNQAVEVEREICP